MVNNDGHPSTPHRRVDQGGNIGNAAGLYMDIRFHLNGTPEAVNVDETVTLLDWLRETRGLTGTKEGCNEGDCGACSVIVTDGEGARCLNACILFMPQIDGKAVRTVEGLTGPDGGLHPMQEAMVTHHGSQCGFCTPGFVVAMAGAHLNGVEDYDRALAGNLCRCTGYAPIARAAEAAKGADVPEWMREDTSALEAATASVEDLADWCAENPEGTLIAGATDVGLWVTKDFRDLGPVFFLNRVPELAGIEESDAGYRIGAMARVADVEARLRADFPSFADMLLRYGSDQVRQAATLGGNIANGSPIGDGSPALIAMGARLHLRSREGAREIALEDFFIDYGKQDLRPGEFVEAIFVPKPRAVDLHRCFKISKRFDQDISAVCGCFGLEIEDGVVRAARVAFGGMAATPMRAASAEAAMVGLPVEAALAAGAAVLPRDFTPISDMRASADYRMRVAQGLFVRLAAELAGDDVNLHAVDVQAVVAS